MIIAASFAIGIMAGSIALYDQSLTQRINNALDVGDFKTVLKLDPDNKQALVLVKPIKANSIGMEFRTLPAGTFTMGEGYTAHQVTLTKSFDMGIYEVTQEQYEKVMGTNPSEFKGAKNPVEQVSWNDAVEFCRKLSELPAEKAAGHVYRLPTEAEWEYACRAGTTTIYSFGADFSKLGEYGWHYDNSGGTTHPVGEKKPNPWGFYDMHGNVLEWCADWRGPLGEGPATDPIGLKNGSDRVSRGGGCYNFGFCNSSGRRSLEPAVRFSILGFRVARGPSSQASK